MTQNRRDFLKSSTVAAAGAALSTLALAPNVHAAGNDTIKVGIIGCGGRGSGAGENVLDAAEGVEIVALGDVFKFRVDGCRNHLKNHVGKDTPAKKFGNKVNVPDDNLFVGLDCHDKVVQSGANYIILTTPPGFRPVCLEAAIAAGKNIFCEKPVAVDGPGIRKVLAAYDKAVEKKLHIVTGTQRHHELGYLETMKRIHGGDIGDIVALRAYWKQAQNIWFRPREELKDLKVPQADSDLAYQLHNWYHFLWTCGDHIVEQHVHNLDVCNWAINDHPIKAIGMGSRISLKPGDPGENGNIFDNFAIDFEYKNGVHMLSMCRQITGCDRGCENNISEAVVGTKGNSRPDHYKVNGKRVITDEQAEADRPYVQEHTDLIASIRAGKPINELKRVAESTLTAIMGRMAGYTGELVTWEKALKSKEVTMPTELSWTMKLETPAPAVPGKTRLT
jgi:predicted dehydrogenase